MRIVGLTGGIGSGKTTVANLLAEHGAEIIDADLLAREAVEPGTPALEAIVRRFGPEMLDADGRLDRKKLGGHVFGRPEALADLNAIVHPAVAALAGTRMEALRDSRKLVVYVVPLFFENGLDRLIPDAIVVSATPDAQRRRVASRDGLPPREIEDRLAAQLPLEEKKKRARWVIDNEGSLDDTKEAVARLYRDLTANEGDA